ncbi:MAG TPA: phage minor head protein, partial [Micromonosporaceae bacterium]|nr:phage minor head protein [Micromonosporaceae bacterium]
ATNRLVGVADTLWEVARRELADGVRAGQGIEQLAARLQEAGGFGEARARTIARTEVVAASNAASLAQAMRLDDPSVSKQWLATTEAGGALCDERTRAAHCAAHEQVQPLGEAFSVGDTWLMYPGQPIGPADAVINCRCGIGYVVEDDVDQPVTASGADEFHLPGKHDQSEHGKDGPGLPDIPDNTAGRSSDGARDTATAPRRDRTSVGETVRKFGSKSVTLAAHDDGQLSLADDAGNKVRLSPDDVDKLRANALYSYDMKAGDEFTVAHTEERDGAPYTTLRMLVRKAAVVPESQAEDGEESYLRDTLAVHLAPNDDPDFDDLRNTPPVEMTARELADLAQALTDLTTAGRVDTGHGQVDMFSDGRWFVLRPMEGPELRLNRRGFRTLDQALDGVVEQFDGEAQPAGPEGGAAERTVDTNIGPVTVSLVGGLGVGDLTIRVPDQGIDIVVGPEQQSAFFDQFGSLSEVLTASAVRRRRSAMPTNVPVEGVVTAAAEVHTGAMVALRPSAEDAARLAVDGGEPADQLHATLAYLGDAADIPAEARERIIDAIFDIAEGKPPLTVEGFAVSVFNPGDANDRDPCIVLGLSGEGLDDVHGQVAESLANLQMEPAGFTLPEQHAPWQPHVTLVYTDDVSMVEKLADRVGPVTFDAIRVAFGGEVFDVPLGKPETESDDGEDEDDDSDFDWDAYLAEAIQAQFQSRMPAQLQRFWIRKLRLGGSGSFRRCVRALREYFPEDTEGLCANLYHEATGRWPGRKKDTVGSPAGDAPTALTADVPTDATAVEAVDEPSVLDLMAALPGEHFHTRVIEGVSTGMRQFAPGAITWRTPPFAYHWQWKSSAHNGLPETVQVGLVTRAVREDPNVHFWGRLDLRSPEGLDYARRLVEGFARWSSVGGDESVKDKYIDVEYVLADEPDPGAPLDDPEIDLMTFNQYRVAEISGVSVPALADATVEPTQELVDTLVEMGVIDPASAAVSRPAGDDEPLDHTKPTREPAVTTSATEPLPPTVIVASGHTITIPNVPPAEWFQEPTDVTAEGA